MSEPARHSMDAALLAHLISHAREKRRPTTTGEVLEGLSQAGHSIDPKALQGSLKVISRHLETLELPDLVSLVHEDAGEPGPSWRPELPVSQRLMSAWEEQTRLWLFDEWLKYEEAILMLQRLG